MKVKFPVFFKQDGPQFLTFMKFLEKNGVRWRTGRLATDCEEIRRYMEFPAYILYWDENHKEKKGIFPPIDFDHISYLHALDTTWFDENYYFDGEVEFKHGLDD